MLITLSEIESRWSLVGRFLGQALRQRHVANTFVFLGSQPEAMMRVVQLLTAALNCPEPKDAVTPCGICQSCRWISNNAHPGLMTLTNWDADAAKVKQAIQVDQFNELLSELSRHSGGFKRVVVLTGVQERERGDAELTSVEAFPTVLKDAAESAKVAFAPLDRKMFSDKVANKLLKTLEEPPRDTHFFIFTDSERKLLDTILSRAQILRFPPESTVTLPVVAPELEALFAWVFTDSSGFDPNLDPLDVPRRFLETAEALGYSSAMVIRELLQLAERRIESFQESPQMFKLFMQRVKWLEHARSQLDSHVREESVLEGYGFDALAAAWGR